MPTDHPYHEDGTNLVYNLLFCDDLNLYRSNTQQPYTYPFDILFSETSTPADLQKITGDAHADPRVKVLAYNKQLAAGHVPGKKELLAVIVEIGLDGGLDVLASFCDGTARYINHSGRVLIWEITDDAEANKLTATLFEHSRQIVSKIGPWDKPRKPHPEEGNTRITFLVSDGLYFGEAPTDVLFSDEMAGGALAAATALLQYLVAKQK